MMKIKAASCNEHAIAVHVRPSLYREGKTLYMFEQFGVDGKLYVEVIKS